MGILATLVIFAVCVVVYCDWCACCVGVFLLLVLLVLMLMCWLVVAGCVDGIECCVVDVAVGS